MGGAKSVPAQKHLTRAGALRLVPGLKRSALIGGIRYYDTVVDDARHTMTVARTAAHYGAVVRTSTQVVALLREGDRVVGVRVRDSEDGSIDRGARARRGQRDRRVDRRDPGAVQQRGRFRVRASKGVHIVVPRDRIVREWRSSCAPRSRCCSSSRGARTGSSAPPTPTGTSTSRIRPRPRPTSTTSSSHVNTVLAMPLTHDDIEGVYAGLRPLLAGESEETSKLSREHAVATGGPGTGRDRRRQVHHLPGDGRRRGRRRRRGHPGAGGAVDHREGAAGRRGRVLRAGQPDRARRRALRAASLPDAAPAGPVRLADRRGAGAGRGATRPC